MASPFNPFAGHGQKTGATGTAGRGQSTLNAHSAPFQPKASNAPRGSKFRGRGRGAGRGSTRGRSAGAAGATGGATAETVKSGRTGSPFPQSNQKKSFSALFGGQKSQQQYPFGVANGTTIANASRNSGQPWQANTLGGEPGAPVPVEDASVLNRYHERYEQLKLDRAKQRENAIKDGQMADPNQPTSLNKAITPVGTCNSMCPEFERVERIVQKMVDKSEKYLHPSTNSLQNMETKMLKRFRRSAAGYDEQLPSDIRTPRTLLQTINYLIRHVLGGSEPLGLIHKFVWDRTRSIRNDFSVQQLTQEDDVRTAVTCLERIARFHIVSLHLLSSPANEEPFDRHQEREQLNNTMLSLMYYYDDNRGRISFPNEDEFRAYYIIFSIHDQRPDLEARVQKWPAALLNAPRVQMALEIFAACGNTWEYQGALDARRPNAIAQGFYTRFFNIINSPGVSYLMACVAEIYFNYVRQTAIRSIWKAYCRSPASQQHRNEEWTLEELTRVLHFDDEDQTVKFCEEQDLQLAENANGELYLNWGSRPVDSVAFQPSAEHSFSETYVESKRAGRTLVAIILGLNIREAARMGMVDRSGLPQRRDPSSAVELSTTTAQDDSLFVSDDDNQMWPPMVEASTPQPEDGRLASPTASSLRSTSESAAQLPPSNPPSDAHAAAPVTFSQPSNRFQPSEPPKMFSSLFSASTTTNNPPASGSVSPNPFSALPSTAPSPFAPSPSPFAMSKVSEASQEEKTLQAVSTVQQSSPFFAGSSGVTTAPAAPVTAPNPFDTPSSSFTPFKAPGGDKTEEGSTTQSGVPHSSSIFSGSSTAITVPSQNPFAASLSTFNPPKVSEQRQEDKVSAATSTAQHSSTFFATSSLAPSTDQKESASVRTTTSTPQLSFPGPSQTTSSSSLFNFSSNPSTTGAEQSSSLSAMTSVSNQPSLSVFDSFKAPTFGGPSPPPLFMPPQHPKEEEVQAKPTQPSIAESEPAPVPSDQTTFTPSFGTSAFQPTKLLFPATPATTTSTVQQPRQGAEAAATTTDQSAAAFPIASEDRASARPTESPRPDSQIFATKSITAKPDGSAVHSVDIESAAIPVVSSALAATPVAHTQPISTETDEEQQRAREASLKKAEKRQQALASDRKRMLDERASEPAKGPSSKAPKVSATKGPVPPAKFSMALSSIKPLPTLPILERVKALTERKPLSEEELEATKPRSLQVDEDEILLSAARIAAEQLRSGPKLSDSWSGYSEPQRSSLSPSSRFSSSLPYSGSSSPPQSLRRSYDVAFAPDTPLGLGRTMSRTEQRIRTTGGHGLAYKPLNFTPDEKGKFAQSR